MTTRYAGVGDDGRVHQWVPLCAWCRAGESGPCNCDSTPVVVEESLRRVCDGVVVVNVEMYVRDKHAGAKRCEPCNEGRVRG